jgi:uncharacterized protein YukE
MATGQGGAGDQLFPLPDGRRVPFAQYLQYLNSLPQSATLTVQDQNGRTTTLTIAQYVQQLTQKVNQLAASVQGTMSTSVLSLQGLAAEMWVQSGSVRSALTQAQSAVTGLDQAFGSDDVGAALQQAWGPAWAGVQRYIESLSTNLGTVGTNLSSAADTVLAADQASVKGFGITLTDPRAQPAGRGRTNIF